MTFSRKELLLAKMQEFDAAMQTADAAMQAMVRVRTEIYSIIGNMPDNEVSAGIEIPLTFYEKGRIIAWGADSEHFTTTVFLLLQRLYEASNRFLTKEKMGDLVLNNDESAEATLRKHVQLARQEMKNVGFPYEIETIRGRGYRLAPRSQT